MKSHPLNQILYGPPGTGKTYNTIRRAVEIIEGTEYSDHAAAKEKFDELRAQGRIEFVTFHQSFGYEDFVEGLRPILDDDSSGIARYEIRDGVLKQLSLLALTNALQFPKVPQQSGATFEQLWQEFIQRIEESENYEIEGFRNSRYRLSLSARGALYGENIIGSAKEPYNASRSNIKKVWQQLPPDTHPSHNVLNAIIGKGAHTNLIGAAIEELRKIRSTFTFQPIVSVSNDKMLTSKDAQDFLNGSQDYELQTNPNNYVLIIDEINRGNISKILGELITLLEPDKRIGGKSELKLTLPVSGEVFGLPQNLFIIGTMNTADKSLALLDIALRRRFKFEEMPPQFSLCANLSDSTRQILETLNARITLRKDRDHRIGHSFFIDAEDAEFDGILKSEILPLLQEYFFNDWDGLRFVLNESGDNGNFIRALAGRDEDGARNRWQWFFDDGNSSLDCLDQLRANYQISP